VDIQRIRNEVAQAATAFAYVEAHPTDDGNVFVKSVMQTSVGNLYIAEIHFANYPSQMPRVYIIRPLLQDSPHRYTDGHICFLHPNYWNPGRHNLTLVLARVAKWLNKYEVWRVTGDWPGAEVLH
jgi:hypothetical protein